MPRKPRRGTCVYCGLNRELTRDHVPPRGLFAPEERVNLITVDACKKCNAGFAQDDEYFRLILALRADLPDTSATLPVKDAALRSLDKPEAKKLRQAIRSRLKRLPYYSDGGIYIGQVPTVKVDGARITRTCERIVSGLYSKYFGRPVPGTHTVSAVVLDFQRDDSAIQDPAVQQMLSVLGRNKNHHTFGQTLEVWYAPAEDDPESSLWLIRLHGVFSCLGFTSPADA